MKLRYLSLLTLAYPFWSATALAQDATQACLTASEEGQKLRDERKFKKAREQFLLCMKDTCPGIVKRDCAEWYSQVEGAMSSVVLGAKVCGKDVIDAKISIDGQTVTERLDGKSIPIDAGPHKFKFEVRDKKSNELKSLDEDVLVSEGQRNKLVTGVFDSPLVDCGGTGTSRGGDSGTGSKGSSFPVGPVVLGAVGVVTFGVGLAIDAKGFGDYDEKKKALEATCVVNGQKVCSQQQVDDALDPPKGTMLLGEVMMGVGIVAAGASVIWLIASSGSNEPAKTADRGLVIPSPKLSATPLPGGGLFGLSGKF